MSDPMFLTTDSHIDCALPLTSMAKLVNNSDMDNTLWGMLFMS